MKSLAMTLLTVCLLPGSLSAQDVREGNETFDNAQVIAPLPYSDTGDTCDNIDDHDEACDKSSTSPDVMYKLQSPNDIYIDACLASETYDTKLYVGYWNSNFFMLIDCNDDYKGPDPCGTYTSRIDNLMCHAGGTYYFVVDGANGEGGAYTFEVAESDLPPPVYVCNDLQEVAEGQSSFARNTCDGDNLITMADCFLMDDFLAKGREHYYAARIPPDCALNVSLVMPDIDAALLIYDECLIYGIDQSCYWLNDGGIGEAEIFSYHNPPFNSERVLIFIVDSLDADSCGDYDLIFESDCAMVPIEHRAFGAVKAMYR